MKPLSLSSIGFDGHLATWLCVKFAEDALPHIKERYKDTARELLVIGAINKWLESPCHKTALEAKGVALQVPLYSSSIYHAAICCSKTATTAPKSIRWGDYIQNTSHSAYLELTLNKEGGIAYDQYVTETIKENMDYIISYKRDSGQRFTDPETVMNAVSDEMKERILWAL
jgi:hypothetical protein